MRTFFPCSGSALSGAKELLDDTVLRPDPFVDGYELRDDNDAALFDLATWTASPSLLPPSSGRFPIAISRKRLV